MAASRIASSASTLRGRPAPDRVATPTARTSVGLLGLDHEVPISDGAPGVASESASAGLLPRPGRPAARRRFGWFFFTVAFLTVVLRRFLTVALRSRLLRAFSGGFELHRAPRRRHRGAASRCHQRHHLGLRLRCDRRARLLAGLLARVLAANSPACSLTSAGRADAGSHIATTRTPRKVAAAATMRPVWNASTNAGFAVVISLAATASAPAIVEPFSWFATAIAPPSEFFAASFAAAGAGRRRRSRRSWCRRPTTPRCRRSRRRARRRPGGSCR